MEGVYHEASTPPCPNKKGLPQPVLALQYL